MWHSARQPGIGGQRERTDHNGSDMTAEWPLRSAENVP